MEIAQGHVLRRLKPVGGRGAHVAHRREILREGGQCCADCGFAPNLTDQGAFDRSGALLQRVSAVFYNLTSSATSPALQAVQRAMAAPMAAHGSAVYMDQALFARVDALHARLHHGDGMPQRRQALQCRVVIRPRACQVSAHRHQCRRLMRTLPQARCEGLITAVSVGRLFPQ